MRAVKTKIQLKMLSAAWMQRHVASFLGFCLWEQKCLALAKKKSVI
jgi:hypothetical protein